MSDTFSVYNQIETYFYKGTFYTFLMTDFQCLTIYNAYIFFPIYEESSSSLKRPNHIF